MRKHVYRETIQSILASSHMMSIAAICKRIPKADFSTIFRNLEQLCEEKIVRKIIIDKDTVLYELIHIDQHHDHFVCIDCGIVESIIVPSIILSGNASITDIVIRGTCSACTAK